MTHFRVWHCYCDPLDNGVKHSFIALSDEYAAELKRMLYLNIPARYSVVWQGMASDIDAAFEVAACKVKEQV